MNNEIKFRGWDGKEMHIIGTLSDIACSGNWRFIDRLVISQFTGVRDKNGNDIYVGDIVDSEWIDPNNGYTTRMKQKIADIGISNSYWEIYNPEKTASVIGNIHENPELLK